MTKEETREYNKQYRQNHKKELKEYFSKHREERKQYNKKYFQDHKEEIKLYKRQYYQDHKEVFKRYHQEWYQGHKGQALQRAKKHRRRNIVLCRIAWSGFFSEMSYPLPHRQLALYHHKNSKNKCFEIGTFILWHPRNEKNEGLLLRELAKCIILTRSEHNRLHAQIRNGG